MDPGFRWDDTTKGKILSGMNYIIRRFQSRDRDAVRRISCTTAFLEYPRGEIFDDDEILADALTLYFTDYEPESCFVVESDGKVGGYLIGSTDVVRMNKVNARLMPRIVRKAFKRGVFFRQPNLRFFFHGLKSVLKGEIYAPTFHAEYPATLHINLDKKFRRQGIGGELIQTYLNYLKERNVKGVHFGTMSDSAKEFFLKSGFSLLFNNRRTYMAPYLGRPINVYIFGKKLNNG
jgi:GNAT superfamily N-acetyltransferase